MIKFKAFDVNECDYEEQMEQFQTEFPQAEFLQITGGHMSPEKIWFKYEPSGTSSTTDKLSVEKLQERCDRYEKALEDIRTNTPIQELLNLPYGCACHEIAHDALAAIGGDDDRE